MTRIETLAAAATWVLMNALVVMVAFSPVTAPGKDGVAIAAHAPVARDIARS